MFILESLVISSDFRRQHKVSIKFSVVIRTYAICWSHFCLLNTLGCWPFVSRFGLRLRNLIQFDAVKFMLHIYVIWICTYLLNWFVKKHCSVVPRTSAWFNLKVIMYKWILNKMFVNSLVNTLVRGEINTEKGKDWKFDGVPHKFRQVRSPSSTFI